MPGTTTIQQYTATWQARLDQTTDLTIRKRHLLSFMSNRGRITGPSGGRFVEWPLFANAKRPTGFGRNTPPTFVTADNLRMPQLNWGAYFYGEQLHVIDLEQNMGKERFIDLYANMQRSVEKAFSEEWPALMFQDGTTATEEMPMFGLKSAFRYYTAATATAGAPRQGYEGKVRLPNGTYAGYDTTLGAIGGNWAGANGTTTYTNTADSAVFHYWPAGSGEGKFDCWSPLVVNTTSQGWGATDAAFNETYCEDQLNFGIEYAAKNNTVATKGPLELILMSTKNMLIWRKRFQTTQRQITEMVPTPATGSMTTGSMNAWNTGLPCIVHNGCFLATDIDIGDDDLLIGVNMDAIEYRTVHSMGPTGMNRLMVIHEEDIPGGSGVMFGGRSHGQFIIVSPRKLCFWYPLGNYTV
jgi:hypothetical protein